MVKGPRWSLADAQRRARVAYRLAIKHQAAIEPRLPPGLLAQLLADRATLGDAAAGKVASLASQKLATRGERVTAERGHRMVMRIRNVVRRGGELPTLRAALGVGDDLRPSDTAGVVAALQAIVAQAAELAPLGVIADDVVKAQALAAALSGANVAQGSAFDVREATTEARHEAQLRVEQAIHRVSAVGALAFDDDDAASELTAARFERLVASSGPSAADEDDVGDEPAPPSPSPPAP